MAPVDDHERVARHHLETPRPRRPRDACTHGLLGNIPPASAQQPNRLEGKRRVAGLIRAEKRGLVGFAPVREAANGEFRVNRADDELREIRFRQRATAVSGDGGDHLTRLGS